MVYRMWSVLTWIGVGLVTLLALWSALAGVVTGSWAAQCWDVSQVGQVNRAAPT
jgi:hypothetical protein